MSKQLSPVTLLAWEIFRAKVFSDNPEPWHIHDDMHTPDQAAFDSLREVVSITGVIDHKFLANGRFASEKTSEWQDIDAEELWTSFSTPDLLATVDFPEKKAQPCTADEKLLNISSQLTSCLKIDKMLTELRKPFWPQEQLEKWAAELPVDEMAEQLVDEGQILQEVSELEQIQLNGDSPLSAIEVLNASIGILGQCNAILARSLKPNDEEIQRRSIQALTTRLATRVDELQSTITKLNLKIDSSNEYRTHSENSQNTSLESCLRDKG